MHSVTRTHCGREAIFTSPRRGSPSSPLKYILVEHLLLKVAFDPVQRLLEGRLHQAEVGHNLEDELFEAVLLTVELSRSLNMEGTVWPEGAAG